MGNFLKTLILVMITLVVSPTFSNEPQGNFTKTAISIGVVVEDLDLSLDFYINVVGMVKVREFVVDEEKARRMGLSDGQSFDIKVLKLEDSEEAAEWKLMSFDKKAACPIGNYIPDDNGIRYVTLFVKSMKPVLDRIRKHKVETLGETPTMLDANRQFVLIRDPDGNFIEFIGPE